MANELPYAISKGAAPDDRVAGRCPADRAITVNAITPARSIPAGRPTSSESSSASAFPAGRRGQPQDIPTIASWLFSPDSAWITGQVIDAEGSCRGPVQDGPSRR
jgi:3-oxoacyl-[acyl-carrier protein] reductase